MSRLEWVLGILLVVLLGIVIILSLIFWFRPDAPRVAVANTSATIIADRADDIAPTSVFEGRTAKLSFAAAQTVASNWQSDAALLQASATWPQGSGAEDLLSGETTWGFTFYSPAANANAMIAVVEDQATLTSQSATAEPPRPMHASGWRLDSRAAVQKLLDEGGKSFMERNGVTVLTMTLSTDSQQGRIEWLVSLFATQTGSSLTMRIDATSGDIIEIQEV